VTLSSNFKVGTLLFLCYIQDIYKKTEENSGWSRIFFEKNEGVALILSSNICAM